MSACAVCFDQPNETFKRLAADVVCSDCIVHHIVPMFEAALKYEHQYPPKFGNLELDPHEFLAFFDKPDELLQKYEKAQREYNTPIKARFYCSGCGAFLCKRSEDKSVCNGNVRCHHCGALTCGSCDANATDIMGYHTCADKAVKSEEKVIDAWKGLERGKDYQRCPKEDCGLPVQLRDGCSHMICVSCTTNFCWLCGAKVSGPYSGHWDQGSACPRWNRPGAPNAQYDNAELDARLRDAVGDRELDDMARRMAMNLQGDANAGADDVPEPLDLLHDAIGMDAYEAIVAEAMGMMNGVPSLPDMTGMTHQQQLAAEQAMADELKNSPLGQLMQQQQSEVDAMIGVAEAHLIEAEVEGLQDPDWAMTALDLLTALRENLSVYVYRVQLRDDTTFQDFEDRHDALERAWGPHQPQLFRHFRRFYEILVAYANVAEIRLLASTAATEGQTTEERFVRDEVASFEVHVRRFREIDEVLEGARALVQVAMEGRQMRRGST